MAHNYPSVMVLCWEKISLLVNGFLTFSPETRSWRDNVGNLNEPIGEKVITASIKVRCLLMFWFFFPLFCASFILLVLHLKALATLYSLNAKFFFSFFLFCLGCLGAGKWHHVVNCQLIPSEAIVSCNRMKTK